MTGGEGSSFASAIKRLDAGAARFLHALPFQGLLALRAPNRGRGGEVLPVRVLDRGVPLARIHDGRPSGRLIVGGHVDRRGRRVLTTLPGRSGLLLLGAPESRKTTMIATILASWPGGFVASSTRPDLLTGYVKHVDPPGRVLIFDPARTVPVLPHGVERVAWSPVVAAIDDEAAKRIAIALIGDTDRDRGDKNDHFTIRAHHLLAALLTAARLGGFGTMDVIRWITRASPDVALATLTEHDQPLAVSTLVSIAGTPAREAGSFWSAAARGVAQLTSPPVISSCEDAENGYALDPDAAIAQHARVFVVAPSDASNDLRGLTVAVIDDLIRSARRKSEIDGGCLTDPYLVAVDELANAPLGQLPQLLSEGGGRGIRTVCATQDYAQIEAAYTPQLAQAVRGVASVVILPGVSSEVAEWACARIGKHLVERETINPDGGKSRTVHESDRFPAANITRLAPGTALVLAGHHEPVIVRVLPPWRAV